MYFDDNKNSVLKLVEDKARRTSEHNKQVEETKSKLQELDEAKNNALRLGNDEEYIKISGLIAVNEAKLERLSEEAQYIVTDETIKGLLAETNEKYKKEVGKRINDIFKMCDKLLKDAEEIENIYGEYDEVINLLLKLDKDLKSRNFIDMLSNNAICDDYADIRALTEYYNHVIDPYCDNGNGRSLRAYAFRLNYK